jgi:hypothetical protein
MTETATTANSGRPPRAPGDPSHGTAPAAPTPAPAIAKKPAPSTPPAKE